MAQILHKRSSVSNKKPATTDLALGELAINTVDGKLFLKKSNGSDTIVEIGAQNITGDVTGSGNGNIALTLTDTGIVAGKYNSITVDSKGRAVSGSNLNSGDLANIFGFTPEDSSKKNVANGYAGLGADGKLPSNLLPPLAITETFVVASDAAMLAVTAQTGDVAVRTDLSKSFILKNNDPTQWSNWQEILGPIGSSNVYSINGKTGTVTLTSTDIPEGTNLYFTENRVRQTPLTAINVNTTGAVVATDTFLTGMGKLQKQANDKAAKGANSDITSLTGLTTALSISQGGTGSTTVAGAKTNLVLDRVENKSASDIINQIASSDITRALTYTPANSAQWINKLGEVNGTKDYQGVKAIGIDDVYQANSSKPISLLGYAGGVRFRLAYNNDINGNNVKADVIDLSTGTSNLDGGVNSLYFNKTAQEITHRYGAAGGDSWSTKTILYKESPIVSGNMLVQTNGQQSPVSLLIQGAGPSNSIANLSFTAGGSAYNSSYIYAAGRYTFTFLPSDYPSLDGYGATIINENSSGVSSNQAYLLVGTSYPINSNYGRNQFNGGLSTNGSVSAGINSNSDGVVSLNPNSISIGGSLRSNGITARTNDVSDTKITFRSSNGAYIDASIESPIATSPLLADYQGNLSIRARAVSVGDVVNQTAGIGFQVAGKSNFNNTVYMGYAVADAPTILPDKLVIGYGDSTSYSAISMISSVSNARRNAIRFSYKASNNVITTLGVIESDPANATMNLNGTWQLNGYNLLNSNHPTLNTPTISGYTESTMLISGQTSITISNAIVATATIFNIITAGNTTINLPEAINGVSYTININYGATGHTVTFVFGDTGGSWVGGSAPAATSIINKIDQYGFNCMFGKTVGKDLGRNA